MQTEQAFEVLEELDALGVHTLKIDRTFIMDVIEHGNNQAIVRAVIAMAKTLGLEAVAEGVENTDQAAFLADEGCDHAQGFLFGHPMSSDAFHTTWASGDRVTNCYQA